MFSAAGYDSDLRAYDNADDRDVQEEAISEEFIAALCAIGDETEARATIARYRAAGATNPILTAVQGTDFAWSLRSAIS